MSGETNKLLTVAALVVATASLALALAQRSEIRGLRKKIETKGELDELVEEVRNQHLERLQRIERLTQR